MRIWIGYNGHQTTGRAEVEIDKLPNEISTTELTKHIPENCHVSMYGTMASAEKSQVWSTGPSKCEDCEREAVRKDGSACHFCSGTMRRI